MFFYCSKLLVLFTDNIHWFATQVTSKVEGTMGYEDFVYFILAEEDKSSVPSLEYW